MLSRVLVVLLVVVTVIASVAIVVLGTVEARSSRQPLDAFYLPPYDLTVSPVAAPGAVVRVEAVPGAPAGMRVWRMVYLYTDAKGELAPVSAQVALPAGEQPDAGWPVILMAHGTVGLGRQCATSLAPLHAISLPGIPVSEISTFVSNVEPLVRAGYAVVQSDYPGLGVPGLTNYLIAQTEATAVLDSGRALRNTGLARFQPGSVVWGHSQGGHAAWFTTTLQPSYAPDEAILGTIMLAPATNLEALFNDIYDPNQASPLTGLALIAVVAYADNYPQLDARRLVAPAFWSWLPELATSCIAAILPFRNYLPQDVFAINPTQDPVTAQLLALNTPQPQRLASPLFIGQGLADPVIAPAVTDAFQAQVAAAGTAVTYRTYPGVNHFEVPTASFQDVLAWLRTLPPPPVPQRVPPAGSP